VSDVLVLQFVTPAGRQVSCDHSSCSFPKAVRLFVPRRKEQDGKGNEGGINNAAFSFPRRLLLATLCAGTKAEWWRMLASGPGSAIQHTAVCRAEADSDWTSRVQMYICLPVKLGGFPWVMEQFPIVCVCVCWRLQM